MTEEKPREAGPMAKIKLGAFIAGGCLLLWFLIVNLAAKCELSLWPLTSETLIPGTLYMVVFLLLGFITGFGLCFYWLRRDRLGAAAVELLKEDEKPKEVERKDESEETTPEGENGH